MKQTKEYYESITIVGGTNDIATNMCIEKVTENLSNLLKIAKTKSDCVSISSIPPRLDCKVTEQRLCNMNERLRVLVDTFNAKFINHDVNFRFMNEIPDESLLLADGVHLSATGVSRLLNNLNLGTSTKCNMLLAVNPVKSSVAGPR